MPSRPPTKLEKDIRKDMILFSGLYLTYPQIRAYLRTSRGKSFKDFDTVEREIYIDWLGKKITGKNWPLGGTPEREAKAFFVLLRKNAPKMGYKYNPKPISSLCKRKSFKK